MPKTHVEDLRQLGMVVNEKRQKWSIFIDFTLRIYKSSVEIKTFRQEQK